MARANVLRDRLVSRTYHSTHTTVLIWDTGSPFGLTPFKSDFIYYVTCNIYVKNVTKFNTVIGIGTTNHKSVDSNESYVFLPYFYYHLPTTDVRLLSSQTYHRLHGAHSIIKGFNVKMVLKNHNIVIPINRQEVNLPIIYNYYVISAQKKRHEPLFRLGMAFIGLYSLDLFGDLIIDIDSSGTEV